MKNVLFLVLFACLLAPSVFGQSTNQMLEVYSPAEIEVIRTQNPEKLAIWEKYSQKGFEVHHSSQNIDKYKSIDFIVLADKTTQMSILEFKSELNSDPINPMKFYWRPINGKQLFQLSGTDIYIVIPSINEL